MKQLQKFQKLISAVIILTFTLTLVPVPAFASQAIKGVNEIYGGQGGGTAQSGETLNDIYFGNYWQDSYSGDAACLSSYTKTAVKWRVLSNAGGSLMLLSDQGLYADAFNSKTAYGNVWNTSEIQGTLNNATATTFDSYGNVSSWGGFLGDAFSTKEQSYIADTTHTAGGGHAGNESESTDKIYLLSAGEAQAYGFAAGTERTTRGATATTLAKSVKMYGNSTATSIYGGHISNWWLRSPGGTSTTAYVSDLYLRVSADAYVSYEYGGVRAALTLSDSILFASAAAGGKSDVTVGSGFNLSNYTGSDYKLTLVDELIATPSDIAVNQSHTGYATVTELAKATAEGGTLNLANGLTSTYGTNVCVSYNASAITDGTANNVSAVVKDSDGNLVNYAKISTNATGKNVSVGTGNLSNGSYTMYIFAEEANGDYETDYASKLSEGYTIHKGDVTTNEGTLTADYKAKGYNASLGNGFNLSFEGTGYDTNVSVASTGASVYGAASTIKTLAVGGNTNVSGSLNVTNLTRLAGTVTVNGTLTSDQMNVTGTNNKVSALGTTVTGTNNIVSGANSTATGTGINLSGTNSIAIGTGHNVSGSNSGAIGDPNNISGNNSYAIGNNNTISGDNTFVLGNNVNTSANRAIGIGNNAAVGANYAIAIGDTANASGEKSVALGNASFATAANASALGYGANASHADSVALGAGSETAAATTVTGGAFKTTGWAGTTAAGVVSVGKSDTKRQLTNVAAGSVSDTSTDAINGSQFYTELYTATAGNYTNISSVNTTAENIAALDTAMGKVSAGNYVNASDGTAANSIAANIGLLDTGLGAKITSDGTYIKKSETYSINQNIQALDTAMAGGVDFAGETGNQSVAVGKKVNFTGGETTSTTTKNIVTKVEGTDGNASVTIALADDIALRSVITGNATGEHANLSASGLKVTGTGGNVSTVTATTLSTTDGTTAASQMTATGFTANTSSVTVKFATDGISAGNQQITNVASGIDSTSTFSSTNTNAANIADVYNASGISANNAAGTSLGRISNASGIILAAGSDVELSKSDNVLTISSTGGHSNYSADNAEVKTVDNTHQLNVVGGTTDSTTATDTKNITTAITATAGNASIDVTLNPNIVLDSVVAGAATGSNTNISSAGVVVTNGTNSGTLTDGKLEFVTGSTTETYITAGTGINASAHKIVNVEDGSIAAGSKDAVNGGQLYTELRPASDGSYVKTVSTTAANLAALDTEIGNMQFSYPADYATEANQGYVTNGSTVTAAIDALNNNMIKGLDVNSSGKIIATKVDGNTIEATTAIHDYRVTSGTYNAADKKVTLTVEDAYGVGTSSTVEITGLDTSRTINADSGTAQTIAGGAAVNFTAGETAATGTKNLTTTVSGDGTNASVAIALADDIAIDNLTAATGVTANGSVTAGTGTNKVVLKDNSVKVGSTAELTSTELTVGTDAASKAVVKNGLISVGTTANLSSTKLTVAGSTLDANELKVAGTTVNASGIITSGTSGTKFTNSGISAGGQKIENVLAGTVSSTSTDAVNGSQLYGATNMTPAGNYYTNDSSVTAAVANIDTALGKTAAGNYIVESDTAGTNTVAAQVQALDTALGKITADSTSGNLKAYSATDATTTMAANLTRLDAYDVKNFATGTTGNVSAVRNDGTAVPVAQMQDYKLDTSNTKLDSSTNKLTIAMVDEYGKATAQNVEIDLSGVGSANYKADGSSTNTTVGSNYATTIAGGTNITTAISQTTAKQDATITVNLDDDIALNSVTATQLNASSTVKVGSGTTITDGNIALGTGVTLNSTDGITVGTAGSGATLNSSALAFGAETYITAGTGINASAHKIVNVEDGSIAAGSKDAVNGGQLYTELRPASDGEYVKTANTTAANLTALDTKIGKISTDGTYAKQANTVSANLQALDTEIGNMQFTYPTDYATEANQGYVSNGSTVTAAINALNTNAIKGLAFNTSNGQVVATKVNGDTLTAQTTDYRVTSGAVTGTDKRNLQLTLTDKYSAGTETVNIDLTGLGGTVVEGKITNLSDGKNIVFNTVTGTSGNETTVSLNENVELTSLTAKDATGTDTNHTAKIGYESTDGGKAYVRVDDTSSGTQKYSYMGAEGLTVCASGKTATLTSEQLSVAGTTVNASGIVTSDSNVTFTTAGISAGNQQITKVASGGTASSTNTNAANMADLYGATNMTPAGNYYADNTAVTAAVANIDTAIGKVASGTNYMAESTGTAETSIAKNLTALDTALGKITADSTSGNLKAYSATDATTTMAANLTRLDAYDVKNFATGTTGNVTAVRNDGTEVAVAQMQDYRVESGSYDAANKKITLSVKDKYGVASDETVEITGLDTSRVITADNGTAQTIAGGAAVNFTAGETAATSTKNITTTVGGDGTNASVEIALADDVAIDNLTAATGITANGSVTAGTGANKVVLSDSGVKVGSNTYITASGLNASGQVITNVADGTADSDAANMGQVKAAAYIDDAHNYYDGSSTPVSAKDAINAVDAGIGAKVTDANYIRNAKTVNENLTALDTAMGTVSPGNYVSATTGTGATTLGTNIQTLDSAIGAKITSDGKYIKKSDTNSVNANIQALDDAISGVVTTGYTFGDGTNESAVSLGKKVTVKGATGKNIATAFTKDESGNATIDISLNDDIEVTSVTATGAIQGDTITGTTSVTAGTGANKVVLSDAGVQVGSNTYITGSGLNASGQVISNVANGTADSDAANMGQVKAAAYIDDAHNYYDGSSTPVAVGVAVNAVDKAVGKVASGTNYMAVYDESTGAGTIAANLTALDTQVKANYDNEIASMTLDTATNKIIAAKNDGTKFEVALGELKAEEAKKIADKETTTDPSGNETTKEITSDAGGTTVTEETKDGSGTTTAKETTKVEAGSVTTEDNDGNRTTQTAGGITTTDGTNTASLTPTQLTIGSTVVDGTGITSGSGDTAVKFTTAGISAGGQVITNVGDGSVAAGSKDAVNGGQLYSATTMAAAGNNYAAGSKVTDALAAVDGVMGNYSATVTGTTYATTGTVAGDIKALDTVVTGITSGTGEIKAATVETKEIIVQNSDPAGGDVTTSATTDSDGNVIYNIEGADKVDVDGA